MTKNQEMSQKLLALIASGMDAVEALKQVCGAEVVDAMIHDLYVALRANN